MKLHLRAVGCHLPYGITQCYLTQVKDYDREVNACNTILDNIDANKCCLVRLRRVVECINETGPDVNDTAISMAMLQTIWLMPAAGPATTSPVLDRRQR